MVNQPCFNFFKKVQTSSYWISTRDVMYNVIDPMNTAELIYESLINSKS